MILYKGERFCYDLASDADWRLKCLLAQVEHEARVRGCGVRITSVIRDSGVHAGRAFDCTFFDMTNYKKRLSVGQPIADAINQKVEYGLGHDEEMKPAALWHDAGSGLHLHVQTPDHELILRQ